MPIQSRLRCCCRLLALLLVCSAASAFARSSTFTLNQILRYPYPTQLVAAPAGARFAWVLNEQGVRNIYTAAAPDYTPHRVTNYRNDDGQEITHLQFSHDARYLVYVRGGDHDANWPARGHIQPDPNSSPKQPEMQVWSVPVAGGTPILLGQGDAPAISPTSDEVAFIHVQDHQVWSAEVTGKGSAGRLFFDEGKDSGLHWSPNGKRLAFVSGRGDHAFIGVFTSDDQPIQYLAPSTGRDDEPRWSPDGKQIAFVRRPGRGGKPQAILELHPHPWAIWTAMPGGGAHLVWQSPNTQRGSFPQTAGHANLHWTADNRLVFLADLDGWPHLYTIRGDGGKPHLLTPGHFMVEDVVETPDDKTLIYNANTGDRAHDLDRRHLFRVNAGSGKPVELTPGTGLQWAPVVTGDGRELAFIGAGAKRPPLPEIMPVGGGHPRALGANRIPKDFPTAQLVVPRDVVMKASDGLTIHGQLFEHAGGAAKKPGIIFVHGGPSRQMLLGWHYMGYYANAYAVNQYLANHGYVVLSVNYRLSIGYGHTFHHPKHWGPTGAAEYKDVLAGAAYLQQLDDVDPQRIGIWGGSYGGYLTALALARNSDRFKAGVDLHGVHDWSLLIKHWFSAQHQGYQKGDLKEAMRVAWKSSPDSAIADWTSPVLLIQGDDDRNVPFHQMVDLARRLDKAGVSYEELVIPNEIHGFLRHQSWLTADTAAVNYFARVLRGHKRS
jgi:dipeptidyl aminopeptidase/acylaminoacyl peptidase